MKLLTLCTLMLAIADAAPRLAHAKSKNKCAKATVVSAGDVCAELKVRFDLSACDYEKITSLPKPEINCENDAATATLKVNSDIFTANLKKQAGWGESGWKVSGSVKRTRGENTEPSSEVATEEKPIERHHASAEEPAKATETKANPLEGITLNGIFDAHYLYNFNRPRPITTPTSTSAASSGLATSNNGLRVYDLYHNQININLIELEIKKSASQIGFLVDLDFGQMADFNVAASAGTSSQFIDEVSKHIGQAYITYNPSWAQGLTFDLGKMYTHIGLEVTKSKDNYQYSRSMLFGYGAPFWHTGLHIGYALLPDLLQVGGYIYNGWNSIYDNNSGKSIGAQIKVTPKNMTFVYNMLTGPEQAGNDKDWKTIHEINATWNPISKVGLGLDYLYGKEGNVTIGSNLVTASWWAFEAMVKYAPHPKYYVSPRFEVYRDNDSYTLGGEVQSVKSYTLTNAVIPFDGFETRFEIRYDNSTSSQRFINSVGTSRDQLTMTLAALYSF